MEQHLETIELPLEGVESEHCALIVNKGLDSVDGVRSHRVELNNRKAVISTTEGAETLPKAVKAIRDLGYGVSTVKKSFPVLGLTCASCAVSTESMLKSQPGVISVSANFANATAMVEYIPTVIGPAAMQAAIRSIGYDLVIDESEEAQDELEALHKKSYIDLKRKAFGAIIMSIPLVVISMVFMDMPYANYIMWALSTPVIIYFGRQFFVNAWKQTRHRSANMDTLVAMSTGVAYIFSVFNTLFPSYWHSRGLHAHVYYETAAVVIAFILLGKLLEEKAKGNTSSAIKKLMGLQPKTVTVVHEGGHHQEVSLRLLAEGDIVLAKPGERIAVDGTVVEGASFVDESMISGEPVPVEKKPGQKVYAGTMNQKGSFSYRADKVGEGTVLAQIIRMVKEAQGSKAPVQKLVDRVAGIFVPVVILISILSLIAWILLGGENGLTQGLLAMVTVLVIACPCALGLATPTAIMAGVGKGAEKGILIKDAESLELARKVDVVVLDKTGTITEGKPEVTGAFWVDENETDKMVLKAIERKSEHPIADAIVRSLTDARDIIVDQFESIAGNGIKAMFGGISYYAGNAGLMEQHNISIPSNVKAIADGYLREEKTVVWFAGQREVVAVIAISDRIKPGSVDAIRRLKDMGIAVHMLTGDNMANAAAVAKEAGISTVKAEVLPAMKSAYIRQLQENGSTVAMVGDGINDSNALAQADVSIAMGKGSDIAMDVARMTIISSDLGKIPEAIRISDRTVRTIRQNLFWAFIYNVIGIPIAAGVLYPFNGFLLNPMIAGAAMALSSISVVSNSLRLKWIK